MSFERFSPWKSASRLRPPAPEGGFVPSFEVSSKPFGVKLFIDAQASISAPSMITAMNTRRNRTAIRALHCRSDSPRLYDRLHTLDRNPFDPQPRRNNCRRSQSYRHCADSRVKPAQVGASTASKVSQSQTSTPIDSRGVERRKRPGQRSETTPTPVFREALELQCSATVGSRIEPNS